MMHQLKAALGGMLAGSVAALVTMLVMLSLRFAWGVATLPELVGDRVAPFLGVWYFLELLARVGGYNQLKQLGVGGVLAGLFVVGAIVGAAYILILTYRRTPRPETSARRRADRVLSAFVVALWLVSVAALWPNLGTNYSGLPLGTAAVATAVGLLVSYAVYGLVLRGLCWFLVAVPYNAREPMAAPRSEGRRALLVAAAGLVAAVGVGAFLRAAYRRAAYAYDGTQYRDPDIQRFTPNERFYVVTKNNIDPWPERSLWRLEIAGSVQRPRTYRFEDLSALPAVAQETTLECISNGVGAGLISNAMWTGVPLRTLLATAGPGATVRDVVCHGVDGYTDTIPLEKAMTETTLVAYQMNGVPLPPRHGYPARLIVPGLVGEKSVKWVTRIELVDHDAKGFYETQGWGPDFVLHTMARFDAPDFATPIPLGAAVLLKGIAFAGDRGVDRAQVSTDDGVTWGDARLAYRGSRLAWVLWTLTWTPRQAGEYRLAVRAIDGTGAVQTPRVRRSAPEGATGYHRVVAHVQ